MTKEGLSLRILSISVALELMRAEELVVVRAGRPVAWVLRDLLLPVLWVEAWLGRDFVWRGNHMRIADEGRTAQSTFTARHGCV